MGIFSDDPDFSQNLMNFGFSTMAAAAQPGARTLGAIGQGGMAMNQMALQNQQTKALQLQNQMIPYQINMMKQTAGSLKSYQDQMDAYNNGGASTPKPNIAIGQNVQDSAGGSTLPSSIIERPSKSMSPDNAAKMAELYPETEIDPAAQSGNIGQTLTQPPLPQKRNIGQKLPPMPPAALAMINPQMFSGLQAQYEHNPAVIASEAAAKANADKNAEIAATGPIATAKAAAEMPYNLAKASTEEFYKKDQDIYQSAQNTKANLANINNSLDELNKTPGYWNTGGGAQGRLTWAKNWNTVMNTLGADQKKNPNLFFDPTKVGTAEALNSQSKVAGMQLAKELFGGQREAATIINATISTKPGLDTTYQGGKRLVNALNETSNYFIDRRQFQVKWAAEHNGSLVGANEEFDKTNAPLSYSNRALSLIPDENGNLKGIPATKLTIKKMLPGTFVITPKHPNGGYLGGENG